MVDAATAALGEAFLAQAPLTGAAFTMGASDVARETVWASDPVARAIAEVQYSLGEGPATTAVAAHRPVLVNDVSAPDQMQRWPIFAQQISELPVRALFAFPLHVGAATIGVCDCYRSQPGPPSRSDLRMLLLGLDRVTVTLLTRTADAIRGDALPGDTHLNRAVVHQATGMLAVQLQVSIPVAFARLRAHAYSRGEDLERVSRGIVSNRQVLDPEPP
ncbi:GAF and ANTAR domain-containing protein [Leekyejoonella antrihumi]|uniref:GAF and ANTAR domain-containing protein n=1 Tax=Leekyejoonella antrihumi TaxID=1660198 RepID=A0A563DU51_9MICO|nr:GAF and ANTAR domain-containing protein [Leekyejoonella antrihumi]TWP33471.1 GAF and ANTAR domain-containing protein [Leekyejoonella antrihumi]